ncbi:MAG: patatin-like phospholipase family protein [Saprospiraceae bacterium]
MNKPKIKILTMDGGGIRGILPCAILAEIERRLNKPIAHAFDLCSGTSTGGIIACGLNIPHPEKKGEPKFSASEFGQLYEKDGAKIFKKRGGFFSGLTSLFEESFGHSGLEELLQFYFGDSQLNETISEVLVTSYDIEQRKPFYFLSRLAKQGSDGENFRLRDIARSTSAAPTYFEPNQLPWLAERYLALVDGGVFANNPSMLAYTEAMELLRQKDKAPVAPPVAVETGHGEFESFTGEVSVVEQSEYFMLSLGTGRVTRPYPYNKAKSWGQAQWIRPIIDILMQGVSESVDYQMRYVLPPDASGTPQYIRINPEIPAENAEMSDVSDKNISGLQEVAAKAIKEQDQVLDQVCELIS